MHRHLAGKLPPDAEEALKAALKETSPRARIRAIDAAHDAAKARYPRLFKRDDNMGTMFVTGRAAFLAIWEPDRIDADSDPAYGLRLIIDADGKEADAIQAEMDKTAAAKWGDDKWEKVVARLKEDDLCLVKDAYYNKAGEPYDGFEGNWYLRTRAGEDEPPIIIGRRNEELTKKDGKPYGGCTVVVMVEIWAQDNKWGRGIRAKLKGVQFHSDGQAFSGSAPAKASDFKALDEGTDDDADVRAKKFSALD